MASQLRVLDAARSVVDDVNALIDRRGDSLLYAVQLRRAAGSVTANIREAYGRRRGAERNQFFRFARGSAEETDEHLRSNFARGRIPAGHYWYLHHRLVVVIKMLNRLMET